jgi:rubrerythrin
MNLALALDRFKDLELKVSKFYRRCSQAASERKWKDFFEEVACEEYDHAMLLAEISAKNKNKKLSLIVPVHIVDRLEDFIDELESDVDGDFDLNWALEKMVQIEKSELNSVYESALHYHTFNAFPRESMDRLSEKLTLHIARIKQFIEVSSDIPAIREQAARLEVKPQNCYKITSG